MQLFNMRNLWRESTVHLIFFFVQFFNITSGNRTLRQMNFIDNFLGFVQLSRNENEMKRNSIVDGGVFVPYKSTTIVHKSRLVPVTYGFVIKKETLKDNPALYKLGVKMLDEKTEKPKADAKLLASKSNCGRGTKLLRLLRNLSKDINKIEEAILEEQSDGSVQRVLTEKSKMNRTHRRPLPQNEVHVSGHKGKSEKKLSSNTSISNHHVLRNWSRYLHCKRTYPKRNCKLFLGRYPHRRRHDTGKHQPQLRKIKKLFSKERGRMIKPKKIRQVHQHPHQQNHNNFNRRKRRRYKL